MIVPKLLVVLMYLLFLLPAAMIVSPSQDSFYGFHGFSQMDEELVSQFPTVIAQHSPFLSTAGAQPRPNPPSSLTLPHDHTPSSFQGISSRITSSKLIVSPSAEDEEEGEGQVGGADGSKVGVATVFEFVPPTAHGSMLSKTRPPLRPSLRHASFSDYDIGTIAEQVAEESEMVDAEENCRLVAEEKEGEVTVDAKEKQVSVENNGVDEGDRKTDKEIETTAKTAEEGEVGYILTTEIKASAEENGAVAKAKESQTSVEKPGCETDEGDRMAKDSQTTKKSLTSVRHTAKPEEGEGMAKDSQPQPSVEHAGKPAEAEEDEGMARDSQPQISVGRTQRPAEGEEGEGMARDSRTTAQHIQMTETTTMAKESEGVGRDSQTMSVKTPQAKVAEQTEKETTIDTQHQGSGESGERGSAVSGREGRAARRLLMQESISRGMQGIMAKVVSDTRQQQSFTRARKSHTHHHTTPSTLQMHPPEQPHTPSSPSPSSSSKRNIQVRPLICSPVMSTDLKRYPNFVFTPGPSQGAVKEEGEVGKVSSDQPEESNRSPSSSLSNLDQEEVEIVEVKAALVFGEESLGDDTEGREEGQEGREKEMEGEEREEKEGEKRGEEEEERVKEEEREGVKEEEERKEVKEGEKREEEEEREDEEEKEEGEVVEEKEEMEREEIEEREEQEGEEEKGEEGEEKNRDKVQEEGMVSSKQDQSTKQSQWEEESLKKEISVSHQEVQETSNCEQEELESRSKQEVRLSGHEDNTQEETKEEDGSSKQEVSLVSLSKQEVKGEESLQEDSKQEGFASAEKESFSKQEESSNPKQEGSVVSKQEESSPITPRTNHTHSSSHWVSKDTEYQTATPTSRHNHTHSPSPTTTLTPPQDYKTEMELVKPLSAILSRKFHPENSPPPMKASKSTSNLASTHTQPSTPTTGRREGGNTPRQGMRRSETDARLSSSGSQARTSVTKLRRPHSFHISKVLASPSLQVDFKFTKDEFIRRAALRGMVKKLAPGAPPPPPLPAGSRGMASRGTEPPSSATPTQKTTPGARREVVSDLDALVSQRGAWSSTPTGRPHSAELRQATPPKPHPQPPSAAAPVVRNKHSYREISARINVERERYRKKKAGLSRSDTDTLLQVHTRPSPCPLPTTPPPSANPPPSLSRTPSPGKRWGGRGEGTRVSPRWGRGGEGGRREFSRPTSAPVRQVDYAELLQDEEVELSYTEF